MMKEQQRNERRRVRERKQYQGQHGQKRQRPSVCVWPFFCEEDSQFQQPPAAALSDSMDEDDDESSGYNMEEDGFALQLMDVDAITANSSLSSSRAGFVEDEMLSSSSTTILHKAARGYNAGRRFFWSSNKNLGDDSIDPHSECLLSFPSTNSNNGGDALRIGPCSSEDAWIWHVNRDGILVRGLTKSERRRKKRRWGSGSVAGRVLRSAEDELGSKGVGCIHRANSTAAILRPCNDDGKKEDATKVGFSLVRYPSASSKVIPQSSTGGNDEDPLSLWAPWTTLEGPGSTEGTIDTSSSETAPTKMEGKEEQHLPTSRTNSQNHASGSKQRQVEVKSTESMLRTTLATGGSSKSQNTAKTSASHIRDAPFAMQGLSFNGQRGDDAVKKSGGGSNTPGISKPRVDESVGLSKSSLLHKPRPSQARRQLPNDLGTLEGGNEEVDSNPHRPRKIPKHPYIEASNEGIWKDPLTSLEYPTDLCDYLGQSKKEAGRHTLMGVGQYYRTAFNIKVSESEIMQC